MTLIWTSKVELGAFPSGARLTGGKSLGAFPFLHAACRLVPIALTSRMRLPIPSPLQGAFRAAVQARRLRRVRGAGRLFEPRLRGFSRLGFSLCTSGIGEPQMARNYYAEINLHIVWHTKGSSAAHTTSGSRRPPLFARALY